MWTYKFTDFNTKSKATRPLRDLPISFKITRLMLIHDKISWLTYTERDWRNTNSELRWESIRSDVSTLIFTAEKRKVMKVTNSNCTLFVDAIRSWKQGKTINLPALKKIDLTILNVFQEPRNKMRKYLGNIFSRYICKSRKNLSARHRQTA